ncbi:MAG: hypothetical protein J3R72DRAFT_512002 [Linnemannia gamsii]|nr:MAG: hypothetical protein J3R72DRAFT_512002 [Linnemannia gamsii]
MPITEDDEIPILLNNVTDKDRKKLGTATRLSKVFPESLPEETIHIIVQRPPQVHAPVPSRALTPLPGSLSDGSRPSTPLSGDLHADIKRITERFFATGSPASAFLDAYVRGEFKLPTTTSGIKGLPKRFRSKVLLERLEGMQSQDLPVFGVSGCGKTRSVIETLCLQWGFYFNAAKSDLGSNDLCQLAAFIDTKTIEEQGPAQNTAFARNMTLVLFLSRLLVLKHCLQVPYCRQTFSSASWAVLQVCPHMFKDIFSELFSKLYDSLEGFTIIESTLRPIVQHELLSVREILVTHTYPNFSSESKLRLVVDEAQVLSDKGATKIQSSYLETDPRPMLSHVLYGFRNAGGPKELTIIYCGTGLSMRTLHWALSSGDGVKEGRSGGSTAFPYIEFPGWAGPDSVHAFISRVKEHLPDDDSKKLVDDFIPPTAVDFLHKKLTGRFRPIVTAIEEILWKCKAREWRAIILDTLVLLTSWKDRHLRGNLCGELLRLEAKFLKHQGEHFKNMSSIRDTLGLFLFRYNLLDATEIVLENEAYLVEAAFGRIKLFGGAARTVIDEPFVLEAVKAFIQGSDPLLLAASERAMLNSTNPTVHGNIWESIMPPVFIETFKNRPLSSWPLLANNTLPGSLAGDVTIVGYADQQSKLAISHKNITTHAFMEAHVKNGSKRENQDIPPFYFPAPHVSGPDIVFYVKINDKIYPCFVQLKLRQVLEGSDAEKALATVSGNIIQDKMDKEHEELVKDLVQEHKKANRKQESSNNTGLTQPPQAPRLQDYCHTGVYVSMVVTYPAEVVKFQVVRPDPEPELEGLERVSINIDDNNFP